MVRQPLNPVTLGVLLDGRIQDRWVLESLRRALAVTGVSLAAVAVARGNFRESLAARLHRIFDRLDEQLRCPKERLFVPTDVVAEFAVPSLDVDISRHGDGWCPDAKGSATLRECDVDVWLCFTATPPCGRCVRIPPGVWVSRSEKTYRSEHLGRGHGNGRRQSGDHGQRRQLREPGNSPMYRSFGATPGNSVRFGRVAALRKGIGFFQRLLERLTRNGDTGCTMRPATLAVPQIIRPCQRRLFRLWSGYPGVCCRMWWPTSCVCCTG